MEANTAIWLGVIVRPWVTATAAEAAALVGVVVVAFALVGPNMRRIAREANESSFEVDEEVFIVLNG